MLSELFIKVGQKSKNSELYASKWHIWLKMLIFGPIEAKNDPGDTPVKMEKTWK